MDILSLLHVSTQNDSTLLSQLRQQITWLIAKGQLKPGDQLPSIHHLADHLGINLHTVRSAYKKLEEDGLVQIRQGHGTHVLPLDLTLLSRSSKDMRSHTVGVIIPSWSNPFYHIFLQGVEEIAEKDQTLLFLCNTHDDPKNAWRDFARLSAKQVDGILIASHDVDSLLSSGSGTNSQRHHLPYVTVDWPGSRGYSVQLDLESAGYQATEHLIQHGHRRVGMITVFSDSPNVLAINQGYERALRTSDITPDPDIMIQVTGWGLENGREGAKQLLSGAKPPTALFAAADMLALGAMQAIKASGRLIPDDMALTSFNDIPNAALTEPALTTVAAPTRQMGREAMKMLRTLIDGKQPAKRTLSLPTELVIRQSCGWH